MSGVHVIESDIVSEEILALIRPNFSSVKIPTTYEKVYKDECMFSFDTPFSPGGLYVSLSNWQGFGEEFLKLAVERGAGLLYVHQTWKRVPRATVEPPTMDTSDSGADGSKAEPTVLALGVDGGFRTDDQKHDIVKDHRLVVIKEGGTEGFSVKFPDEGLPTMVSQATEAIIDHQGAAEQTEVSQWVADNELAVSKYAENLPHEETGRKISSNPKTWVCEESGKTENLWLNLSTGYIGSGRQNWDGSGGTGAALRHYEEAGRKYPLAVKLGTITPNGADVYSYAPDEDNLIKDPKLGEHLARWGIDIFKVEKTDKTMAELEVELNKSYDFNKITEAGAKLKPLSGPGFTGIKNLGNSCYMNSCLQLDVPAGVTQEEGHTGFFIHLPSAVLCALPELTQRYGTPAQDIFKTAPQDVAGDFPAQMSKVASALLSGKYSSTFPGAERPATEGEKNEEADGGDGDLVVVAPRIFKQLVGHGHSEFSSGRQQDAAEYMQHLLEFMRRAERAAGGRLGGAESSRSTPSLFQFRLVDRLKCQQSGTVKYTTQATDNMLSLQVPVEAAVNQTEVEAYKERLNKRQKFEQDATVAAASVGGTSTPKVEEDEVKPVVPFSACLELLTREETLPDYRSPATGRPGPAVKHVRFKNFPRYLLVKLSRYFIGVDWQPKKLDVEVEVPLTLDLEGMRSKGMQEGEVPMQQDDGAVDDTSATSDGQGQAMSAAQVVPDEELVSQLMAMGFQENGCRRAAVAVSNASAELAMNWVLEHMEDADFNDPLPIPGTSHAASSADGGVAGAAEDPATLMILTSLGFTERQAQAALKATSGDAERGADWLFSHTDNLDAAVAEQLEANANVHTSTRGGGDYGGAGEAGDESGIEDGTGRYSLVGFISHVGKNTGCGHYVAHIRKDGKDGRWVIFDDRKVAESEHPPLSLGYLYLFKRDDA